MNSLIENNTAEVSGKIIKGTEFCYEICGESFYNILIEIKRISESFDTIPVIISERLIDIDTLEVGKKICVKGQFRSHNNTSVPGKKLILSVFAHDIYFVEEEDTPDENNIVLNGFICKTPLYRVTPFGREIGDVLLAVNRSYGKSDYIPCILWGRNARYSKNLSVGDNIKVYGRIQSRTYQKKIDENNVSTKVAYEVSVGRLEVINAKEAINEEHAN